jgi:hypothetical protein
MAIREGAMAIREGAKGRYHLAFFFFFFLLLSL